MEQSQEKGISLIEADRQRALGDLRMRAAGWILTAQTDRLTSHALLPSSSLPGNTFDCLSINFLIFPPSPSNWQNLSNFSLFFSTLTNGLVTMETAAYKNLTYLGRGLKFLRRNSFLLCYFLFIIYTNLSLGNTFSWLRVMVWMSWGKSFWWMEERGAGKSFFCTQKWKCSYYLSTKV